MGENGKIRICAHLSLSCMYTMLLMTMPTLWAMKRLEPYSALSHTQSCSEVRLQKASGPSV